MVAYPFCPSWAAVGEPVTAGYAAFFFFLYRTQLSVIAPDAEADIAEGYWFYERQSPGLGDYFRSCLIADIESLAYYVSFRQACEFPVA